jgi:hypothetical protein
MLLNQTYAIENKKNSGIVFILNTNSFEWIMADRQLIYNNIPKP